MSVERIMIALALLVGILVGFLFARSRLRADDGATTGRILLPFVGNSVSGRVLDAALRIAGAEHAMLAPAYLAVVSKQLPLDCAIPAEAARAMPILEAIEQRAARAGVGVDSRIERGRSYRHALRRLLEREQFARIVVPVAPGARSIPDRDLAWLLEEAPVEVMILRPGPEDEKVALPSA